MFIRGSLLAPDKGVVAAEVEGLLGGMDLEGAPGTGLVGVFVEDGFVDGDAEAGGVGEEEVSVFEVEGFGEDFVGEGEGVEDGLAAVLVAGVFEPGGGFLVETGSDLGVGDGFEFSAPVVEGEFDLVVAAGGEDLVERVESAVVGDVGLGDVDALSFDEALEAFVRGFVFSSGDGDDVLFAEFGVGGVVFRR